MDAGAADGQVSVRLIPAAEFAKLYRLGVSRPEAREFAPVLHVRVLAGVVLDLHILFFFFLVFLVISRQDVQVRM